MSNATPHVLVVDDDDRLRRLLEKFLREQGFVVTTVSGTKEARRALETLQFDALVLDVMMPGETGLEFLAALQPSVRPPVLMLSAMGEADDRIKGLEVGADDYLAKPFEPKELVLRIQSILRRNTEEPAAPGRLVFGENIFDMHNGQLQRSHQSIALTSGEVGMMRLLGQKAGLPVSRDELAATLPGTVSERSVDVHITRLRKKIEEHEGKPVHLQTVRGKGYVLYAARQDKPL
ncbi:MAG: response regulator [Alphaproteobacteria bacterium]